MSTARYFAQFFAHPPPNSAGFLARQECESQPVSLVSGIGLDVHKRKISYCVKDSGGKIFAEGSLPATRLDLDL